MRNASGALIALLNGNTQFRMADLLTLTLQDGSVVRLTNADFDVVSGGNTFSSAGPQFSRTQTKLVVGIQVDSMTVTIFPASTQLLTGLQWPQACAAGALDGARVVVERAFMPTWGDTTPGTLIQFSGRVSEVMPSRNKIELTVKSDLVLLDIQMPRNVIQPYCIHTVYDSGCAILKSAFQVGGTVTAGSTAKIIQASALGQPSGYFDLGTIVFTSGALNGNTRTVKTFLSGGSIEVSSPFPLVPATSDTFTIVPGCDKTQATCSAKFANLAHFRGYPYVPQPESAE